MTHCGDLRCDYGKNDSYKTQKCVQRVQIEVGMYSASQNDELRAERGEASCVSRAAIVVDLTLINKYAGPAWAGGYPVQEGWQEGGGAAGPLQCDENAEDPV